jgi:hypothetical protein
MEVKHRFNQVLELGFPLGGIAKLFAQHWEGDVTIVMPATLAQVRNVPSSLFSGIVQIWNLHTSISNLTNVLFSLCIISIRRSYRIHHILSFRRPQVRVGDALGKSSLPSEQIALSSLH